MDVDGQTVTMSGDNTGAWVVGGIIVLALFLCCCCGDGCRRGGCGNRRSRRRRHHKSSSSDSDGGRRRRRSKKCGKCHKKVSCCKCPKKKKLKLQPACISAVTIQTKTLVVDAPDSSTTAVFIPGLITDGTTFNPSTTIITSAATGQTVTDAIFSLAPSNCCSPLCKSIRPRVLATGTSIGLFNGITVSEGCNVWVQISATVRAVFNTTFTSIVTPVFNDYAFGQIIFTPCDPCGVPVVVAGLNPVFTMVGNTDDIDVTFSITPLVFQVCSPGTFSIRLARTDGGAVDEFFAVLREMSVFTVAKIPELCWVAAPSCCTTCNVNPCCCAKTTCNTCYQNPCCC
jgi:hypothetical protein